MASNDPDERTRLFNEHISAKFHLHELDREHTLSARRSLRNTYVRYLRGWGVDSNSIEGAVLKAWVESRIGLRPTFHRRKVTANDPEGQLVFATDRMKGLAGSNAIDSQLDLGLHVLPVRAWPPPSRAKVASPSSAERTTPTTTRRLEVVSPRERIVRLNNLSSFTPDSERAFEFGSTVWEVRVPTVKVFFWSQLFPRGILKGEDEFLVIGGVYRVKTVL